MSIGMGSGESESLVVSHSPCFIPFSCERWIFEITRLIAVRHLVRARSDGVELVSSEDNPSIVMGFEYLYWRILRLLLDCLLICNYICSLMLFKQSSSMIGLETDGSLKFEFWLESMLSSYSCDFFCWPSSLSKTVSHLYPGIFSSCYDSTILEQNAQKLPSSSLIRLLIWELRSLPSLMTKAEFWHRSYILLNSFLK